MKLINSMTTIITLVFCAAVLSACEDLKVGLDDGTQDTLECLLNQTCDATGEGEMEEETSDNDGGSEESNDADSGDDSSDMGDSTGGINIMPVSDKGSNRYFMGTYSFSGTYRYPYDSCGDSWGNGYDFPGVLRAYSYGNKLDFEDNFGNLVWVADVYPDDTFDFMVQFLDSFGRPSNTVACTCEIETPYYYQSDYEEISCVCDPTYAHDEVCSLTYKNM